MSSRERSLKVAGAALRCPDVHELLQGWRCQPGDGGGSSEPLLPQSWCAQCSFPSGSLPKISAAFPFLGGHIHAAATPRQIWPIISKISFSTGLFARLARLPLELLVPITAQIILAALL